MTDTPQPLPEIDEQRIRLVAAGIYKLMSTHDDVPAPAELSDEDRQDLRDMATGVIRIWDGLNG